MRETPNRVPCMSRLIFLYSQLLVQELPPARNFQAAEAQHFTPKKITGVIHYVVNMSHDRDIRTANWILFPCLRVRSDTDVCIFGIGNDSR